MTGGLVGDLLDGYELLDNCWDELFESPGCPESTTWPFTPCWGS